MKNNTLDKLKHFFGKRLDPDEVKSFTADQESEAAYDAVERGICRVPLDQIVGSVGRYHDFDGKFRPKQHLPTDRFEQVKKKMREGKELPPVKLYQIKDEYYVLDGNHRIAAAKDLKRSDIRASIVEFIPSKNTIENVLYRERAVFVKKTRLPYTIKLTELGQYAYLLNQIELHQKQLNRSPGKTVSITEAAEDWYLTIYSPLVAIIRKGNLLNHFKGRTLDDLYAYVSYHQWEKGRRRKYGIGIDNLIPKDMEAFRKKMAQKREFEYPEMLREITAFILMNIRAKDENRIMDNLFSLNEVREIHSIHGTVDILIKIVLTRDLLSSDAEIISEFVTTHMRQIPEVVSTQTLIPGRSMIKDQRRSGNEDIT
ncbi:MAG: ParB N-terminal domain-containing protein [Desulfobacteraceae bacterium]|nr:ParB N-terminal domain-containing protein [Desulfobacteraceae bacterium]